MGASFRAECKAFIARCATIFWLFSAPIPAAHAAIPDELESAFSEAVLFYHAKDYDGALRVLDSAIQKNPKVTELLELKALTLRSKNDINAAVGVYLVLIRLKGRDSKESAPYFYELGGLYGKQKKSDLARVALKTAMKNGYDPSACRFFLGLADFNEKKWESAKESFIGILGDDNGDYKPVARLYLAQIAGQLNDSIGSVRNFSAAKEGALEQLKHDELSEKTRALARQVVTTADQQLKAYERSAFFINAGLFAGYDSNVLSIPNVSLPPSSVGTGPSSFFGLLQYGVAYASSPLGNYQILPSYKGALNLNGNNATHAGEFFSHDAAVYLTVDPVAKTSYGLKVEGLVILQHQTDPSTGSLKFGTYSLSGSFGPYLRTELWPQWTFGVQTFFQPQKYYVDEFQSATFKRSGFDQLLQIYLARNDLASLWNPAIVLSGGWNQTSGEEFRSKRASLDLADTLYFTPQFIGFVNASTGIALYGDRLSGKRSDKSLTLTTGTGYRFDSGLNLLLNVQWINNFSDVESFRYSRVFVTTGANYYF